jgi:hypothetical protein
MKRLLFLPLLFLCLLCGEVWAIPREPVTGPGGIVGPPGIAQSWDITLTTTAVTPNPITINYTLTAGETMTVDWGDGDISVVNGTGGVVDTTHNYAAPGAGYKIKIKFSDRFAVTRIDLSGEKVIGTLADFRKFTSLTVIGIFNTSISGDIGNISRMTSMVTIYADTSLISGDIASLSGLKSLTYLNLRSTSINTYTQGVLPDWDACTINISNLGLSQTEVDDFLCDLDTASVASTKTLTIKTGNDAQSAAGDACEASLELKGWKVN